MKFKDQLFSKNLTELSNDELIKLVFALPKTSTTIEKELANRLDRLQLKVDKKKKQQI